MEHQQDWRAARAWPQAVGERFTDGNGDERVRLRDGYTLRVPDDGALGDRPVSIVGPLQAQKFVTAMTPEELVAFGLACAAIGTDLLAAQKATWQVRAEGATALV